MSFEPVSFGTQLLGTLIGAGVGFALVVRWDRSKKKTERKEAKKLMIDSLVKELEENLTGLNKFKMPVWNENYGKFKGEFGLASVYAFQSIVSGGNFGSLPIKIQKPLREIYQNSELYNTFMDDIIHYSSFKLANLKESSAVGELTNRLEERRKELQKAIPKAITELTSPK